MKAYIEGIEAMKSEDESVKILTSEPLINMVPPLNATPEQIQAAVLQYDHQFQVMDILCGRICPELRGKPEYIDVMGLNYYYNNQWVHNTYEFLRWKDDPHDIRWKPLSDLLTYAYHRYHKPIAITETSHPKEDRPRWISDFAEECAIVLDAGIPLTGICIYPIIDRLDWDDLITWHNSGLWDIEVENNGTLKRILNEPFANALLQAQNKLDLINNNMLQEPVSVY